MYSIMERPGAQRGLVGKIGENIDIYDLNPMLNGGNLGQIVFDTYTKQLKFAKDGIKVFTGIGYVVSQAIDVLPFVMKEGSYHPIYNTDPATGDKKKLYLGKYNLDSYFSTKEYVKYPDCNHIIIFDWNMEAIQMITDILMAVPDVFRDKRISIIHGDIKSQDTINKMLEISREYGLPINTIYFTNIFNSFEPEHVQFYKQLSSSNITLICDPMYHDRQIYVNTMSGGKSKYKNKRKRTKRKGFKKTARYTV